MKTGLQFPVKKLLAAIWTGSPLPGIPRLRPMSRSQITPISRDSAKLMGQSQTHRSLITRLFTPAWCG